MKWNIFHRTKYDYASPVRGSHNELHLQPFSNESQSVDAFVLKVLPSARVRQYRDFYFNCVHHFEISEPHSSLLVESHVQVTTHSLPRPTLDARPANMDKLNDAARTGRCYDFLQPSRYVDVTPEIWRLAVDAVAGESDIWQCALRLMRFTHAHLDYERHSTHVHTHPREVLEQRRGVCQDFAHVMLSLCRCLSIPALYVSGYLATETASTTHAWMEVFVPGLGWQALDPTHNRQPDETYVKIAVGRDYADVPPVTGMYRGTTDHQMTVEVRIERGDECPV